MMGTLYPSRSRLSHPDAVWTELVEDGAEDETADDDITEATTEDLSMDDKRADEAMLATGIIEDIDERILERIAVDADEGRSAFEDTAEEEAGASEDFFSSDDATLDVTSDEAILDSADDAALDCTIPPPRSENAAELSSAPVWADTVPAVSKTIAADRKR